MNIAIIGAGASGLVAIKTCVDEGLRPICFEKQDEIGGLWNYIPTKREGATVYKSTIINTSKEMMCFSDFPIPKEFPNFMHNSKVQEYFKLYAKKFDLVKHVQFHTEVVSCTPADGFAKNGQWRVLTRNIRTKEDKVAYYNGILVCIGHHAIPYYPLNSFPGIENFKGKYMHSHEYRDHNGYEDLRVVIVGIGNSGGDIAVELSRHSKQVFLSTRRGAWIIKRIHEDGMPFDYSLTRRFLSDFRKVVPLALMQALAKKAVDSRLDHAKYGLKPEHGVFSQHPSVNDDIANRIITGSIQVRGNVVRFTENSAIFEDGTEEAIDAVIFATGYSIAYSFLSDDVLKVEENDSDLYKYIYPISLPRNTLAIIGAIQPLGAVNPISEMQCRWATKVFKGDVVLPSRAEMKSNIDKKREAMQKRYVKSRRHTIQVDYLEYMDELAAEIGCGPKISKLLLTDPKLAAKLYFGPNVPCVYRLEGPGKWPQAREAILTAGDRVLHPLQSRKVDPDESKLSVSVLAIVVLLAILITLCLRMI